MVGLSLTVRNTGLSARPWKAAHGSSVHVNRLAVDREQVIALLHVRQARLEQGRAHFAVPGRRLDNVLDPVGPVFEREIAAQVAHAHRRAFLDIAPAAIGVGGVQLRDEFPEHVVDVPARHGVLEQLAVALAHLVPVHAVHARVVEIVALQPPRVVEDLPPLGHRVNRRLEVAGVDLLVHLLPFLGLDDGVVAAFPHQQLLAVGGQLHVSPRPRAPSSPPASPDRRRRPAVFSSPEPTRGRRR